MRDAKQVNELKHYVRSHDHLADVSQIEQAQLDDQSDNFNNSSANLQTENATERHHHTEDIKINRCTQTCSRRQFQQYQQYHLPTSTDDRRYISQEANATERKEKKMLIRQLAEVTAANAALEEEMVASEENIDW